MIGWPRIMSDLDWKQLQFEPVNVANCHFASCQITLSITLISLPNYVMQFLEVINAMQPFVCIQQWWTVNKVTQVGEQIPLFIYTIIQMYIIKYYHKLDIELIARFEDINSWYIGGFKLIVNHCNHLRNITISFKILHSYL